MRVAVLMSTYNGSEFIREQLDSILKQKIDCEYDIIIRDDGSSDSTVSIIRRYMKKYANICLIEGQNVGAKMSFLELVRKSAMYDFYAFSDQDDYWKDSKLSRAISMLTDINGPALYFSNAELADRSLSPLNKVVYTTQPCYDFYSISCFGCVLGCTVVFNQALKEVFVQANQIAYVAMHDSYMSQLCAAVGGTIIYDSDSYILYRQHGTNVVGVPTNLFGALAQKIKMLFKQAEVSIARQSEDIYSNYCEFISAENRDWLKQIACYNLNLFNRARMAFSPKLKSRTMLWCIVDRLTILFGKR